MIDALLPVLAQAGEVGGETFHRPPIDWHAVAPLLTILGVGALLTLLDLIFTERARPVMPALAGLGCLVTMIPILTLAADSESLPRVMFGGALVVDQFTLVLMSLFLLTTYVVVLLSTNYIAEGDYWENEYYGLLLAAVMGMMLMAAARDLISIFVALELLSIPAYMLAAWRKRDLKSNEAGMKYYLMGVFASAIMLYGMSLLYGVTGSTVLAEIGAHPAVTGLSSDPVVTVAILFIVVGFAFKVSAVPFHTWSPDTYEGAPTPVTSFLATASKTAGFVALMELVIVGFYARDDVYAPLMWLLAAVTMTVGNLIALRQTNLVRLMAYSGVAQAGYIIAPLAVAGENPQVAADAVSAIVTFLIIYAAMNLGAFAVIIAVARRTKSAEIESFSGLFHYAPGLTAAMTVFLFSLAGIPFFGGWFAKFEIFYAVVSGGTPWAYALGVLIGVNSVVALFYYAKVARYMWMEPAPEDVTPIKVPVSLRAALAITAGLTILFGVLPWTVSELGDSAGRILAANPF